jgi:Phage tail protein (Tail_P2_I)
VSGYNAWIEARRPLFTRLPAVYRESLETDWLVAYWDEYLVQVKDSVDSVNSNLDPLVCDTKWLPFLAYMHGFKPDFWSDAWPEDLRRLLLFYSYRKIWPNKGLKATVQFVFDLFGLLAGNPRIFQGSFFILGTNNLGDSLGSPADGFYVLQSQNYSTSSPEWLLVNLILDKLAPAWIENRQIYDHFILGLSSLGDPLI